MPSDNEIISADSRSTTPGFDVTTKGKKRAREDKTQLSPELQPPSQQQPAVSVDGLLVPLDEPDWHSFGANLRDKLDDVRGEEAKLMDEYRQWCWVCIAYQKTTSMCSVTY